MTIIDWTNDLSVGIKEIDDQHKHLIDLINVIYVFIKTGKENKITNTVIDELFAYVKVHFSTEEKYMDRFDYKEKDFHIKEHHDFTDKVNSYKKEFDSGRMILAMDMLLFLREWFRVHVNETDKKYGVLLKEKGIH